MSTRIGEHIKVDCRPQPSAGPQSPPNDPGVIARRLQYLFENNRRPDGKRHSLREVVESVEARGGPSMSIGYLSQLCNGVRTNPMMNALQALGKFFGVPLSYFDADEDTAETNARLKFLADLQHAGVENLAMHAVGLSPETMYLAVGVIDRFRAIEGLPAVDAACDAQQ